MYIVTLSLEFTDCVASCIIKEKKEEKKPQNIFQFY